MRTRIVKLTLAVWLALAVGYPGMAGPQKEEEQFLEVAPGVKRSETLIIDQIFRYQNPANFNFWTPAAHNPTRQAIAFETLWYVDQQTGEWINGAAEDKPVYDSDYKKMSVKLRSGLYWSDGVEFTADDLVFTVETLMKTQGMNWGPQFRDWVDKVTKTDKYAVTFELKRRNPRFHSYFTARYNACFMMPRHVWEKVDNKLNFTNNPPVVLGSYTFKDQDPQGYWDLWERREDWQRTVLGKTKGQPQPKYVLTIFYGPSEKSVLAMLDHKLDIFMDAVPEAFDSLVKKSKTARSWYAGFPYAWQDEFDGRAYGFNHEKAPFDNKDVRWALALALDGVALQTEHVGGVPRMAAMPQPPTPLHQKLFYEPLEPWMRDLQIQVAPGEVYKPYDPDAYKRVAEWAQKQGHKVEGDLHLAFGWGWWKHSPAMAEKLLVSSGFKRDPGGKWLKPDGTPWRFKILTATDELDCFRLAFGAQEQWKAFGIDVEVDAVERQTFYNRQNSGDYEVTSTWGGGVGLTSSAFADKWPFIEAQHSNYYKKTGEVSTGNQMRLKDAKLDQILDTMAARHPDDPEVVKLGQDYMKWFVENMHGIVTVGFKKFVTHDDYFWTGFPSSENPYSQPNFWFQGGRNMFPSLKPVKR
jgi:peptide/nickel transport system substrate-binding protein